ncbi:MAG TPA: DNA-formamidopyrimidine glycosylase family protein [Solirubrobacteraceae bacterium]|nr:DNA-formamidopyrimidine glycosylase family protein [Solirubrobacteraceae bacterium]
MPEGDTIHRAAAQIRAALAGSVPQEVLTPQPRHRLERWPQRLAGRALLDVEARGKHMIVRFEGALSVHSHLRMTGAWGVARRGERWRRAPRRAWLVIRAGQWEVVEFDGPVLELISDVRARTLPQLAALGQDVIGEDFDERLFLRRLREDDPTRPIGDALLNQRTVAGIGNLWKAETCFAVAIDPWRELAAITDEEALALIGFARERMGLAARDGPSTRPRSVYRRAGRACPRCGQTIRQRGQWENNRITFWCPSCQS